MITFFSVLVFCIMWIGMFIMVGIQKTKDFFKFAPKYKIEFREAIGCRDYFTAFKLTSRMVLYISMAVLLLSGTCYVGLGSLGNSGYNIPEWLYFGDCCEKIVGEYLQGLWIPLVALFVIAVPEGMILINYKSDE